MEFENRIDLSELQKATDDIRTEMAKVLVGQKKMVDLLLTAILANGHILIEGVPGVAKTLTAKLLSKTLSIDFSRIQFTPDLMPSDVLGTSVFNQGKSDFEFKQGPIFSNIILIDEINRAPAKTQAALFEVMEERQVTSDGNCYSMSTPFLVFATQNPIEQEGTYRLPEAQLDRFLFKINVGYPSLEEEMTILDKFHEQTNIMDLSQIMNIVNQEQFLSFQELIKQVHVEPELRKYIAEITNKTRNNRALYLGASPRASISIMQASKAYAAIHGRDFVTPDDIKEMAEPILNHRIMLTAEKEMEGATPLDIIRLIIQSVEVPR